MPHVLVTGGAGFFGGILKRHLLRHRWHVSSIDRVPDANWHPHLTKIKGDVRDPWLLNSVFRRHRYDAVFHCAAVVPRGKTDEEDLWTSNVDATRKLAKSCRDAGVSKFVFISTSCLWGGTAGHAVREGDAPAPVDLYGESKLAAEDALSGFSGAMELVILRSSLIVDSMPQGLLAILFDFIHDGKTVWIIGEGGNRYQLTCAEDLLRACMTALHPGVKGVFHIGNPGVKPLRELWQAVIDAAGTASAIRSLPEKATRTALRIGGNLGLLSLGPYESRMISDDFFFDTAKARERLGWHPSLNNEQLLVQAYRSYTSRREDSRQPGIAAAWSRPAPLGVLRLLKWVS